MKFIGLRGRLGLLVVVALVVAGCTSNTSTSTTTGASCSQTRLIEFIGHGSTAQGFWSTVKNGIDTAVKDLGAYCIKAEFNGPQTFDMIAMGNLIDAAIAKKPAGLIVSLPDVAAEGPHIKAANDQGIPVMTMNSGDSVFKQVQGLLHVGANEFAGGQVIGQYLYAHGVRNIACDNPEPGNVGLVDRCNGVKAGFTAAGGSKFHVFNGNPSDPIAESNAVKAEYQRDPSIDAFVGQGHPGTVSAVTQMITSQNLKGKVHFATFDSSPAILQGLTDGTIDLAIAQQPFLQGYLPVTFMAMYLQFHTLPGGANGIVATGPYIIDKSNIDAVKKSVANNTF